MKNNGDPQECSDVHVEKLITVLLARNRLFLQEWKIGLNDYNKKNRK